MALGGMNKFRRTTLLAGVSLAAFVAVSANGGVKVLTGTGWQVEWADSLNGLVDIILVEPYVPGSNVMFIQKSAEFTQGPVNGIFPSIPIIFTQIGASTISNIVIDDEIIKNNTGVAWTDFHIDLLDSGNATFNPAMTLASNPGNAPIGWTITPFTQAAFSADLTRLDMWGGIVGNGTTWFPGDGATDGQLWINVVSGGPGNFTSFTLKETPTPAPGALALLGLGALVGRGRRRS